VKIIARLQYYNNYRLVTHPFSLTLCIQYECRRQPSSGGVSDLAQGTHCPQSRSEGHASVAWTVPPPPPPCPAPVPCQQLQFDLSGTTETRISGKTTRRCVCSGLQCTGTLIGRQHVLTAAHCVFDITDTRVYLASLDYFQAQNGSSMPFNKVSWTYARIPATFAQQVIDTPSPSNVAGCLRKMVREHHDLLS